MAILINPACWETFAVAYMTAQRDPLRGSGQQRPTLNSSANQRMGANSAARGNSRYPSVIMPPHCAISRLAEGAGGPLRTAGPVATGAIATGRKSATTVWSLATRTIAQRLRRRLSQHRRSQPEATKFMAATTTQSVAITCAQIATIPTNSASEASVAISSEAGLIRNCLTVE